MVKTLTRRRRRLVLGVIYVIGALFYFWTATSSGDPIVLGQRQNDYYNLLVDGFASGQLSVVERPSAALLALKDPYNPNEAATLPLADVPHDLSLYRGRFYLSWGPTPALTLIWPWRLLHIGQLGQGPATLIYALVGLAFVFLSLDFLLSRYLAQVRGWQVAIAATVLATCNTLPYLLRRPLQYELAISSAFCFLAAGLYLLLVEFLGGRYRPVRLGLASLCLGLAVGARYDLLVLALPLALLALQLYRRAATRKLRALVALLAPFALIVVLLALYNDLRFGNPFQTGSLYQLEGYNPMTTPLFRPGYVLPSLYYYLVAPIRPLFAFPYLALGPPPAYPFGVPSTYAPEITGGFFAAAPISLLLLGAPVIWRQRRELKAPIAMLAGSALLVVIALCISIPGATERYEGDAATLVMLAALLTWLAWTPERRPVRRLVALGGGALALLSIIGGIAISLTGPGDELRSGDPATYRALEDATTFLPRLATTLVGHADIVRVIDPIAGYPEDLGDFGTAGIGDGTFYLQSEPEEVDIVAPHAGRAELTFEARPAAAAAHAGKIEIRVTSATSAPLEIRLRRSVAVPLALRSGLNRIFLTARANRPLIPGGAPHVVRLRELRLLPYSPGAKGSAR